MSQRLDIQALPESLNLTRFFLSESAARAPNAPALYYEDKVISYKTLAEQVDRATAVFRKLGLQQEQRVLLMLPDQPQFAAAWFGAVKAGGVVAAVNPDQKPEEIAYYLNYTRAQIVVAHASALTAIEQALPRCEHLRHLLIADGPAASHLSFEQELDEVVPDPRFAPTHRDDPAVWLFTSGSTGFPKAAVHKQRDFIFNALTFAQPILNYSAKDLCVSVPRLAFGYALGTNLLFPLMAGGASVLFKDKPTPEKLADVIRKHKPTFLTSVPTAINAMVTSPAADGLDFSSLRVCISAGEALPEELYTRWKKRTGVEILDGIGSAEMFHIFITNRFGDVKLGSLGRVVEGYEAKICDDEGKELPHGDVGTLWIRGGSIALEYWQQYEKSKDTFRGEWCVSADKFRRDEEGYFYFCGRGDDMLKIGGKWLSPVEVENALLQHPAVSEAAVLGFKDADGLEKPKAFVVCKAKIATSPALGEELKAFVREKLEPFKAPRQVVFLDALPKSERGKVLKSALRG
ncbi:MAG: benzoate-CoA ligase family protein [Myxococcaceae bacterium]